MITSEYLKGVDIFEGLRREQLDNLVKFCEAVTCARDTIIFTEGDNANFLYILVQGRVDLRLRLRLFKRRFLVTKEDRSKEMIVTSVPEGKAFGWAALTKPSEYEVSAHCIEQSQLTRIDGQRLLTYCQEFPETGFFVMRNLATIIGQRLKAHRTQIEKEIETEYSKWW
jgi:CRP-like cAMP-binding protein